MEPIDAVLELVRSLAARGWDAVLARHGLRLSEVGSIADLTRRLTIDRDAPGFDDLHPAAQCALAPGRPVESVLYHALSHPGVVLGVEARDEDYASLEELDLVENAIFALAAAELDTKDLVAAVFSYQFRPSTRTPHGRHADLLFSRTGIARLGSQPAKWDAARRSFHVALEKDAELEVRPARYAVWLAKKVKVGKLRLMGHAVESDKERTFLAPVHKLFAGTTCLPKRDLAIAWHEHHKNEKLARGAKALGVDEKKFDLTAAPFVRESGKDRIAEITTKGASVIVGPPPQRFVQLAVQTARDTGKDEVVRFRVPKQAWPVKAANREFTTLHLLTNKLAALFDHLIYLLSKRELRRAGRKAPEFLNIRHRVNEKGEIEDLNAIEKELDLVVKEGGYEAAMYEDPICDGCVTAVVDGLASEKEDAKPILPAFSVLAAVDYFPFVDQSVLVAKFDRRPTRSATSADVFSHGSPEALCEGRLAANVYIVDPTTKKPAFDPDDRTMVVVATTRPALGGLHPPLRQRNAEHLDDPVSWLTDAAAGHFAPGWDVTFDRDGDVAWYHTYGLGSPFVEDLKLCSSGAGSWPAVAPDASRTYKRQEYPTAIPLLDDELGHHRDHPRVRAKEVPEARGWDGEHGPFFERHGDRLCVNFADIVRADYVTNALDKLIRTDRVSHLKTQDILDRVDALRLAIRKIDPEGSVTQTKQWLVAARRDGESFVFDFARAVGEKAIAVDDDPRRLRIPVDGAVTRVTITGRRAEAAEITPA